jgi:hypothetical protein
MNKYLDIIVWLSFALIGGKSLFSDVLNYDLIEWPLTFVFTVAASIALALSLIKLFRSNSSTFKSIIKPISYLAVFLFVLGTRASVFYAATEWHLNLENLDHKITTRFPPSLLNDVVTGETEEGRIAVAQLFYQNYGAQIPYKTELGTFSVYQPTSEDVSAYAETASINKQWSQQTEFFSGLAKANKLGVLFLSSCFILTFFFSLLLGLKRANKQLHRTP